MTTAPPLVFDATRDFLRRFPPFNRMPDDALEFVVPRLELAYFGRDATLLSPQAGDVAFLYMIQRGSVGSRPADPRAGPDPALGPGDFFPVGALSAGGPTTKFYTAVQDTFCYRLPRDDFIELRRRSPEFERWCTQAITETLKQSLAQLQGQYSQLAAEQQTLTRPLAELLRRAPVTAPASAPLTEALALMRDATVRTIVVVNGAGAPVGIFTLIDLLQRVVLAGRPLTTPVAEVMTAPAVTVAAEATRLRGAGDHGRTPDPAAHRRRQRPGRGAGVRTRPVLAAARVDATGDRRPCGPRRASTSSNGSPTISAGSRRT